jgi:sulfur carrier protein
MIVAVPRQTRDDSWHSSGERYGIMRLTVNGAEHDVATDATVAALLETLALRRDGIAVALNDDVVPRAEHATRTLNDGDRLEIIVAVAGG